MSPNAARADSLRILALLAAAMCLAGCSGSPASKAVPVPKAAVPLDASYDWHVLVAAPFGSLLKDAPVALHEVLLFGDETHGATAAGEMECFGVATAPRFMDRSPEAYLLCFKHDRLARIEATVRLPQSQAAQILADACALWMRNAAAGAAGDACEGSQGAIEFSGRLEEEADHVDTLLLFELTATPR